MTSKEVDKYMKMRFTGTFAEWVGKVIIWTFVTIFTFGLGLIWVVYDLVKWEIEKTEIEMPR